MGRFFWGLLPRNLRVLLPSPFSINGATPTTYTRSASQIGRTCRAVGPYLTGSMRRRTLSTGNGSSNSDEGARSAFSKESIETSRLHNFQRHVLSDSTGGWDQCWEEGCTPWDLGQPTPVLVHLHRKNALSKGRALIPGCGTGYDVLAIACPEHCVVGLDISRKAIQKAIELTSTSPNADYATFVEADFFTWHPTELFDLIFDYTFFCAIEPHMRAAWARQVQKFLKPDGELITLMFPISGQAGGPPYIVSVEDYEKVMHPLGFRAIYIEENEMAVSPRKGREKLGRWKRSDVQSML